MPNTEKMQSSLDSLDRVTSKYGQKLMRENDAKYETKWMETNTKSTALNMLSRNGTLERAPSSELAE